MKQVVRMVFMSLSLATVAASGPSHAQEHKVAIANLGPHPALNAVISGFKEGLAGQGYVEGENLVYEYKDANFDPAVVAQMITALEATDPDLMLTVTTPITQASKRAVRNKSMPIVFAPVTDPVDAGLVPSWEHGSERFVGASNLQDMNLVLEFAGDLFGEVNSLGILFNPGDANDVVNISYAQAAADAAGVSLKAVSVETTNDIPVRMDALKDVDFVYLIPSSMLQPATPAVAAAANRNGIPVVSASSAGVEEGLILATFSVSWFRVGQSAGNLAAQILGGAKPSELPIYRPSKEDHSIIISAKKLESTGMELPAALAGCDCVR